MSADRQEVEAAFKKYWQHGAINESWHNWAKTVFTEDVLYVERIYGTMRGRDAVQTWISELMANNQHVHAILDWYMIEGNRVVVNMTNRYYSPKPAAPPFDFAGITILEYAHDGLFSYEEDYWDLKSAKKAHQAFNRALEQYGSDHIQETATRKQQRNPWPTKANKITK